MSRGTWGKGWAYPLIGDKVHVHAQHEDPRAIWEVRWFTSSKWSGCYTVEPWPRGAKRNECPDQSREFPQDWLRPLDLLTQVMVEIEEAEADQRVAGLLP